MWDQTSLLSLHSKYLLHHLDALELLALLALFSGFRAIFSVLVVHWNHLGPLKNTDASPTSSQIRSIGSRVQPESGDFLNSSNDSHGQPELRFTDVEVASKPHPKCAPHTLPASPMPDENRPTATPK